jgi:hypothetical protein
MIVFNTTGSGVTPSTDTLQTNWAGYSVALMALGNNATAYAQMIQFIPTQNPHQPPVWFKPQTTPQQLSFNSNSNGTGTEFSMLVQRSILRGYASPSPSPSASPSNLWTFNAFTAQASSGGQWTFFDSLGAGGPTDPQFVSPRLCMTEPFDNTYYGIYTPPDTSAEIASLEIANNPVSPTACP